MNRALSYVLVVLVLASAALNVLLFRRQKEIEKRLDGVEKRPPATSATTDTSHPEENNLWTGGEWPKSRKYEEGSNQPVRKESTGSGTADTTTATLPPDLKAAIAKEVEEQIKKSGSGNVHMSFDPFQDPMTVMEKELNLSPSQKIRIQELLKKKQEENMKVIDEDIKMKEKMEKHDEIDRRYEELIKRELDLEQQKKYEELKKSGRLMTGTVIKFGVKKEEEK